MKRILFTFFILSGLAANAQNYNALNGLYGGELQDMVMSGTTIIGSVYANGIVISTNNGSTWTKSNTGITNFYIYDLERDPDTGKIYAVANNRLFSSADNGATWIVEASTGFTDAYKIKKTSGFFFMVSRYGGKVYRSSNGTSWSQIFTLPTTPEIRDFDVNSSGHLLISTWGNYIYRSTNNGLNFDQIGTAQGLNPSGGTVYSVAVTGTDVYATTANNIYKSTNNGATFSVLTTGGAPTAFGESKVEIAGSAIFVFGYSSYFVSTDAGATWTTKAHPISASGFSDATYSALIVSATEAYVSLWDFGTFRTTDGGTTWNERSNGITAIDYYQPNQFMFAATSNRLLLIKPYTYGLYVSIDDGATWDHLSSTPLNKELQGLKKVGTTIYTYGYSGINRSTDNAVTFSEIWNGQISGCIFPIEVLANSDANTFYSVAGGDCSTSGWFLLKSTNGAVTWTKQAITGLPSTANSYMPDRSFNADATSVYIVVYNYATGVNREELYKINPTTGVATQITNIPNTPTAYIQDAKVENNKLYVTTNDAKIHISSDGGTSWTTVNPSQNGRLKIINDNTFYIMNGNGVFLSIDAGVTWVNTGSFTNFKAASDVVISTANYSYVTVNYDVVYKSAATVIPPSAPTALSVTGLNDNSVGLKWTDNSTNEDYFIIEMKQGAGGTYDSIGSWTRTNTLPQTFTHRFINGLSPETTYFFRVRAKGAAGKSAYTNEVSATTTAACPVNATIPDNRSWAVTTGSGSAPTVLIQRYPNTDQYYIEDIFAGSGSPSSFFANIDVNCNTDVVVVSNSWSIPNGMGSWNGTTNTLVVRWQSANNVTGTPISVISTYTLNASDPTPLAPTSVSAYVKTSAEVVISWLDSDYGATYLVERATASGGPYTQVGSIINYGTQTTIDNSTFTVGQTYYYRVTARNIGNVASPASAVFSMVYQVPKFEANSLVGYDNSTQGMAWIDLENDGDEDLLLTPFSVVDGTIGVYENLGNGTFQKITVPGISDFTNPVMRTISVGDINNDGRTDFILSSTGAAGGGHIFINDGNKVFTRTNILPGNAANAFYWYASLTDINVDGKLDPVFTDDVATIPSTTYKFYTQNNTGGFDPYEIGELAANAQVSRGGGWADIDNDGDMDFLRTSYGTTATDFDLLFINQGGGVFVKSAASGFESDAALAPRSVSWGDYDNDLDIDVFVGHNGGAPGNMLYMNNGNGTFTRQPSSTISEAKTAQSFGSVWGDFDNDADLDLITGNTGQANLYLNDGTGVFTKFSGSEYLVASDNNRTNIAFAAADYDNNGTLDVATGKTVTTGGFPTILLKNNLVVGANTKWLKIRLEGTVSNRSGIGARIIITTPDTKKQMRQVLAHTGYASSGSLTAHFGLKSQSTATVTVHWPSGIVQTVNNVAANQLITITEDGSGPGILSRTPDVSSTNNAANTTVTITLNEASTPQAGKLLMLYLHSDLSTPITGVDVTAAAKSGDTYTFTLPSKLLAGTQYNISVDAGAFKDVYGNASLEFTTGSWTFTVAPAPVIATLSPANNATSVVINTPLQITFDKAVTAVAGKHLKVLDGATTLLDVDVATTGTVTNTIYSVTPATAFPNNKLLKVTVDAGAFVDATKFTDFAGVSTEWNFTTILEPDTQSPVIVFDNAQIQDPLEKNFATFNFGISVTDNRQVASATMKHRKTGEKDFVSTSLTFNTGNSRWEGSVPNSFVNDMGFEYFFEAADNATPNPNVGRLPLQADAYLKSKTSFKNSPPSITLPSQGTTGSWKIISVPYVFENGNNSASTLFSALGGVDKAKWRLLIYQSNPDAWNENIASIERGKGYFINTTISGAALSLSGAIAPPETRDNLFTMNLQAGWNQIGNPYTVAISISDVKNFNAGLANAQFVTYSNGNYSPVTQLAPFEGGFVNVPAATTIKIPFTGQTLSGGRAQAEDLSENIDDQDWRVKMNLTQGSASFEMGYVGMAHDANLNLDHYDMVKPPRFFDFVEMSFAHPEHVSKKFSGDVVPTNSSNTWDFTVDSNLEGVAELHWNNTTFTNAINELYLLDIARQVVIDMRKVGSYSFDPKESMNFKVYFGQDLRIAPESVQLGRAFPNPTSGNTQIAFSLPDAGGQDQFVTLDLLDATGRTMATIAQGRYQPGFYETAFNARELTNGFYTYRLIVKNSKGRNSIVNKLIIK